MTISEQVKLLSGSREEQAILYQFLIDKVSNNDQLSDTEIAFMMTLKKNFTGEMSAVAYGVSNIE